MRLILILSCCFFLFTSEKCEQPANTAFQYDGDTYVKMKKTGCFGRCPMYEIKIDGTGKATYNGKRFVEKTGKYTRQFPAKQTNALMRAFEEADYWQYEDEYLADITDLPYTHLTFSHRGKTKKITLYFDVPEKLTALANLVASFANTDGWEAEAKM